MRTSCLVLFMLLFGSFNLIYAQNSIQGEWKGAINIQGQQLAIIFHLEGEETLSGTIDIPQQGAMGLALTQAEQREDSVFFAFFTGQGDGVFEGVLESEDLIEGTFTQGPASFPFEVKRSEVSEQSKVEPGIGEEILITTNEIDIAGTLVLPEDQSQPPLVIMISGSGAQDRDSNVFNFKIFAEIAEHLKEQGIASFRYDDRGVGKSTGDFSSATLEVLSGDVNAIIDHFSTESNHQFSEVILIGHSQGGVVAGKSAAENEKVDQLILMASTGVDLKEILRFQVKQAYGVGIHPEERVDEEIRLREGLMKAIQSGENIEEAREKYHSYYRNEVLENLSPAQKSAAGDLDALAETQTEQLAAVYSSPQVQSLLFYDPVIDLELMNIPVLVLFGGKDTQVTEALNRKPIESALEKAGVSYEVELFPNANHLFQQAESGQVSEYALLEKKFVEGFLEKITKWIKEN